MRALASVVGLVILLASEAAAVAAEPTDLRRCPLRVAEPAQTVTVDVGGGWSATLRIPGRLQTPTGAIQWTVRMSAGSGAPPVAGAQFVVDGRVAHEARRLRSSGVRLPSYVWYVYTSLFRPGRHALEVRVRLASGDTRVLAGSFIASRCPAARFWASTVASMISFDSTYGEGIGPRIASATVRALPGARFVLPRARAGTVVGRIAVYRPGGRPRGDLDQRDDSREPTHARTTGIEGAGLRERGGRDSERCPILGSHSNPRMGQRHPAPIPLPLDALLFEAPLRRGLDGRGVRLVGRTRTCQPIV